jgi:hypothetical protein
MEDNPGIQACMRLNAKLTKRVELLLVALARVHEGAARRLAEPRDHGDDQYAFTVIATVVKEALGGHPMPSNAAGPWRKFDAEHKATWPRRGEYLIWDMHGYGAMDSFDEDDGWMMYNPTHYAEILSPESRGK